VTRGAGSGCDRRGRRFRREAEIPGKSAVSPVPAAWRAACSGEGMHATRGFTLVEAVIGLALIGTVCLTAAFAIVAGRGVGQRARHEAIGVVAARARLADLAALTFAIDAGPAGEPIERTDTTTDLSRDPPSPGGPGLTPSPPDALGIDRMGYVDYLDDTGRPLGGGGEARAQAAYVRRWAIVREGRGAGEIASFAVAIVPIALAYRIVPAGPVDVPQLLAQPGVVCLRGARSRHGS
jgi:type II secretory pathway pseudopilin PulG